VKSSGVRRARLIVFGGAVLTGASVPFLASVASLPWPDAALCGLLLVLIPTLSVGQLPVADENELRRIPAYVTSAATIGILAGLCWLVGTRSGGVAALGLVPLHLGTLLAWTVLLGGVGLVIEVAFRQLGIAFGWSESPFLKALLPRTAEERWAFAGLSLAAGFGEEIVYRGYAIPILAGLIGPIGAAALTSAVFGVLHAYQGTVGIVRTAVLGGLLAWGFLSTGSLWPAVAAHALIDVVAGLVLAKWLMVPERTGGVGTQEEREALPGD